jgi:hypothetical protein
VMEICHCFYRTHFREIPAELLIWNLAIIVIIKRFSKGLNFCITWTHSHLCECILYFHIW